MRAIRRRLFRYRSWQAAGIKEVVEATRQLSNSDGHTHTEEVEVLPPQNRGAASAEPCSSACACLSKGRRDTLSIFWFIFFVNRVDIASTQPVPFVAMATDDLKKFLQLAIDERGLPTDELVSCTTNLLIKVPTARPAVLALLSTLFHEYSIYFVETTLFRLAKKSSSNPFKSPADDDKNLRHHHQHLSPPKLGKLMCLILSSSSSSTSFTSANGTAGKIRRDSSDGKRVSVESLGSVKEVDMEETPASPTSADEPANDKSPFESMDIDDEEISEGSTDLIPSKPEDILISKIHESIITIMTSESKKQALIRLLVEWAIEQITSISANYSGYLETMSPSPLEGLNDDLARLRGTIEFWLKSPVIQFLLKIIQQSIESSHISLSHALLSLIQSNVCNSRPEWICCHLLTSFGSIEQISQCIQLLLSTSSVSPSITESIFAFLSANNPQAIINCSKSNLSFLLRLCSKSKPLLDVFTADVSIETINIHDLNKYVSTLSLTDSTSDRQDVNLKRYLIDGLLSSDNSFQLLMVAMDLTFHPESSDHLRQQLFAFLTLVLQETRAFTFSRRANHRMVEFLNQLKSNYTKLITHQSFSQLPVLKKFQLQLMQLLSVYFGFDFTMEMLHEAFCCEPIIDSMISESRSQVTCNFLQPKTQFVASLKPNPILSQLLQSLQLHLGLRIKEVLNELLKLSHREKRNHFWLNFASFAISGHSLTFIRENFDVNLSLLSQQFIDLMHSDVFEIQLKGAGLAPLVTSQGDSSATLCDPLLTVLVTIQCVIDRNPKLVLKRNHSLCVTLAINYMNMVEKLELLAERATPTEISNIMSILCLSQKIMSSLVNSPVACENQEILTRTFMECILEWNEDLEQAKRLKEKPVTEVSLMHENINYGGQQVSFKFRKIPLNPNKDFVGWKNQSSREPLLRRSLSRQLILDGLRVCIKSMDKFSLLLVEMVTPDVLFNDLPWPDEDFSKVTIERDLFISKMYKSHTILWDLTEMIAISGQLRNCAALVRALMSVQLTAWASGTMIDEKPLAETQKLISILAQSSLIPQAPFKYVPDVLASLDPWDIYSVLSEIWRLLKDTNSNPTKLAQIQNQPNLLKPYLERLRIIMSHKAPSLMFVKIFKGIL